MRITRNLCALSLICSSLASAAAQTATSRIVSAANQFLATLNEKQRTAVLFPLDDEEQRKRWSNFPVSIVPRSGVSLKEMNPTQRSAATALIGSALSQKGLEKVQQVMDGDEILKNTDQGPRGARERRTQFGNGGPHAQSPN
jgi:hypothetical protein